MTRISVYRIEFTLDRGDTFGTMPDVFHDHSEAQAARSRFAAMRPDGIFSVYYDHPASLLASARVRSSRPAHHGVIRYSG